MTPGLRENKGSSLRIVVPEAFPEEMRERTREIVALTSSNPRKGHATTLMWSVCHEADLVGVVLILHPKPFGAGMDEDQLERYYQRFGFRAIQREPAVLMARQPEGPRLVTLQ